MKRIISILVLVLAALLWTALAGSAAEEEQQMMLEGRLIDLSCYVMGMSGDSHAQCALQCVQKGLPVGLLEQKTEKSYTVPGKGIDPHALQSGHSEQKIEKIYTILLPSPGLAPYMEQTVRITGKIYKNTLLVPTKVEVKEGETWKSVELPSAM